MKRLTFEFRDHTDDTALFCDRIGELTIKELEVILQAVKYELEMAQTRQGPMFDRMAEK